jgi:hypothetical protein
MAQYQVYFDTLEGERKYNVDIGDEEPIEDVLRDILVELTEKGHVMKGLAIGTLKVVWGGAEGRELDLSLTLPEQGVRPNEVLRVLVEGYVAGSLRRDRIDREWRLLDRLAALNPGMVELADREPRASAEVFVVRLYQSPGVREVDRGRVVTDDAQVLRLEFTRFYPDVPIECYTEMALFHPNIRPETGFVCLWEEANPQDSVIQAVARAQAMAAYRMVNLGGAHVMNGDAASWYRDVAQPEGLVPLAGTEVRVHEVRDGEIHWLEPGRGLADRPRRRIS